MHTSRLGLAAFIAAGLLQGAAVAPARAQDNSAMLDVLLRPAGWRAEWAGPGGSGITEVTFVRQGDQVTARIRLVVPFELTCEHAVAIGPGTVTFDGCRDPGLKLTFDPKDPEIPFRGSTPRGYEWKFKAK